MLDAILTTALQIIIVLDICGVVLYFLMSGAAKSKEAKAAPSQEVTPWRAESSATAATTPSFTLAPQMQAAMAGTASVEPPPIPEWVTKGDRATDIYGLEGTAETVPDSRSLSARVSGVFSSFKIRFSRQTTSEIAKSADLKGDRAWLNKVLDSFREEM